MQGVITFVFATVLIFGAFVAFFVILIGGWIVGTIYLWIEGVAEDGQPKLTWWDRSKDR